MNLIDEFKNLNVGINSSEIDFKKGFKKLLNLYHPDKSEDKNTENFNFVQIYYEYFKLHGKDVLIKRLNVDFGDTWNILNKNKAVESKSNNKDVFNTNKSSNVNKSKNFREYIEIELNRLNVISGNYNLINENFFTRIGNVKKVLVKLDMDFAMRINPILVKTYKTKLNKINELVGVNFDWICNNYKIFEDILNLGQALGCDVLADLSPILDKCFNMLNNKFRNGNLNDLYLFFYSELINFYEKIKVSKFKLNMIRNNFKPYLTGNVINTKQ
jgi:hypothetical protein